MIHILPSGWTFIRQLGAGDVEHVRHQLFQVLIASRDSQVEQLKGVYRCANDIGMMCRPHVNVTKSDQTALLNVMQNGNMEHQLEIWKDIKADKFESIISRSDIVIMPGNEPITGVEVYLGVMKVWQDSRGRFTAGNFGRKPLEQLYEENPGFKYPGLVKDAWEVWNA